MNIRDFIMEKISTWGMNYSPNILQVEIQKVGLNPQEQYTPLMSKKIDLVLYHIIPDLLIQPQSISEGGYSVSYDKKGLTSFYLQLCKQLGKPNIIEDKTNTVIDISQKW